MASDPTSSTSKETKSKSGRTPEQQAARDARKAAKAAKAATSSSSALVAESSSSATPAIATKSENEDEADEESSTKKRKRPAVVPEGEELEIDVGAPAPLSKAEIRAQRKKIKRGDSDAIIAPPKREYEERAKRANKAEKDAEGGGEAGGDKAGELGGVGGKRQNSVWIGNIAFKTTAETLKEFFEKGISELGGTGEGCVTRVNLPKKAGRGGYAENKGFAYVDLASPALQGLAVQLSERFFEGRRLLIKKGDDHNPTPNARTPKPLSTTADDLGSASRRPETSSLYFGNLPFDATELGLRDLVEENAVEREVVEPEEGAEEVEIGERGGKKSGLKKVRLGAFEDTGRCKGFAFLDFLSARHAKVALANRKNHYFGGRRLTVEFASEEAAKRSGGRPKPRLDNPKPRRPFHQNGDGDDSAAGGERRFPPRRDAPPHQSGDGEQGEQERKPKREGDQRGKKWEATGRPRPGAALAMAKRENVAIVEGTGEKITFD
ncbi:hypothetical protein CI109_105218 [Kwoniella shandongensis]|uniref:Uncharacterized protein n=1 Tax=Kwoniella shandongensis TaxID=1734106 RepID=A0A5M6C865_9TREE|nr:uncharacterized protein CI109_002060 [Kwoniella shandongensis]KAA5529635.1 hypothetical protein CI109_002060 [Kwoniella shandongensis]